MTLNCLIIDDEPLAQELLEGYISNVEALNLVGSFSNGIEANPLLQSGKIDLIFLDINMPKINGLDLLRSLRNPPITIITTAYREHGLEAYDLDAIDYLEKPFSFHRFLRAVNKAQERADYRNSNERVQEDQTQIESQRDYIFIKTNKKFVKLRYEDVSLIESISDYVKIHLQDSNIVIYESLKNIEGWLPKTKFLRVHKSFIVSLERIEIVEGNRIILDGKEIPIGGTYRKAFLDYLDSMSK